MGLTSAASRSMLSRAPEKFSKRMRVCPSFPTRYATSISVSGILWTDAIRFFWEGEVVHGDGDQLSVVSPPIPLCFPRISGGGLGCLSLCTCPVYHELSVCCASPCIQCAVLRLSVRGYKSMIRTASINHVQYAAWRRKAQSLNSLNRNHTV